MTSSPPSLKSRLRATRRGLGLGLVASICLAAPAALASSALPIDDPIEAQGVGEAVPANLTAPEPGFYDASMQVLLDERLDAMVDDISDAMNQAVVARAEAEIARRAEEARQAAEAARQAEEARRAEAARRASVPTQGPVTGDVWYRLRVCESGNNYAINTGNGYYGAYQFSYQTWQSMGTGYEYPHHAPPAVQDDAARRLQARAGWGQWPSCARKLGLI